MKLFHMDFQDDVANERSRKLRKRRFWIDSPRLTIHSKGGNLMSPDHQRTKVLCRALSRYENNRSPTDPTIAIPAFFVPAHESTQAEIASYPTTPETVSPRIEAKINAGNKEAKRKALSKKPVILVTSASIITKRRRSP